MIEIKGKYNEAKIFTDVVDSASIAQVQELCNQDLRRVAASGSCPTFTPGRAVLSAPP